MRKKKKLMITAVVVIAAVFIAWRMFFPDLFAGSVPADTVSKGTTSISDDSNILIAYYSLTGNRDYQSDVDATSSASITTWNGEVLGNSEVLARMAQEASGGDVFFIEVSEKYPESFDGTSDRSSSEQSQGARPELASHLDNMDQYDTVVLIYPNWWGSLPMGVLTFLEEYDFSGKQILPIATSQGSGLGSGPRQISSACPDATVLEGLAVGGRVSNASSSITNALEDAGIIE